MSTEPKCYRITSLRDILLVPTERRGALFRDMEYGYDLHELAFGDEAFDAFDAEFTWTDDGSHDCDLISPSGEVVLSLKVTEAE